MPASKKRTRRLSSLDTAEGKREAEAAAKWWADFNRREGKNPASGIVEAGHPAEPDGSKVEQDRTMLLTRCLPGYADALASARAALLTLYGRTPLVREMYQASLTHGESMEFVNETLLALAGYGDGSHGSALPHAHQWHEGEGSRPTFVRSLNTRQANAVKKPLPNGWKAPLGDIPTVPRTIVSLWVWAGLWLASSEDAAAVLCRHALKPGRGHGAEAVTGDNIRRVVSDLRLARYEGTGRFVFHDGGLWADTALLDELKEAASHNG